MVQRSFGFLITLGGDTCASVPTSNILLNVEEVDTGDRLKGFKNGVERTSRSVCRSFISPSAGYLNLVVIGEGFVASNAHFVRQTHNHSVCRYMS